MKKTKRKIHHVKKKELPEIYETGEKEEEKSEEVEEKEVLTDEQIESQKEEVIQRLTGKTPKKEEVKVEEQKLETSIIKPEELEKVTKNLKKEEKEELKKRITEQDIRQKAMFRKNLVRSIGILLFSVVLGVLVYISTKRILGALIFIAFALILFFVFVIVRKKLEASERIKVMEIVFPDFIELVASNLRAGMTVDKSLLLSSRKEFAPLDTEILQLGRDVATGKDLNGALLDMAKRINSDKIGKTISLIVSGIKSGGNMGVLLSETASNMRQREFIEKKAASNIVMYKIFIIFAITIGAPILFALSSVLVEIMGNMLASVAAVQETAVSLPFTFSKLSISVDFVIYFSLAFLFVIDIISALVIGLVTKGKEGEGVQYMPWIIGSSVLIFFVVRMVVSYYFSGIY